MFIETIIKINCRKWKNEKSNKPVNFFSISIAPKIEIEKSFQADFKFEQKKRGKLNKNN